MLRYCCLIMWLTWKLSTFTPFFIDSSLLWRLFENWDLGLLAPRGREIWSKDSALWDLICKFLWVFGTTQVLVDLHDETDRFFCLIPIDKLSSLSFRMFDKLEWEDEQASVVILIFGALGLLSFQGKELKPLIKLQFFHWLVLLFEVKLQAWRLWYFGLLVNRLCGLVTKVALKLI